MVKIRHEMVLFFVRFSIIIVGAGKVHASVISSVIIGVFSNIIKIPVNSYGLFSDGVTLI